LDAGGNFYPMVFVDISRKAKSFGAQKNKGMICMGKIFKRRIIAFEQWKYAW
jgi:hypothetical protein